MAKAPVLKSTKADQNQILDVDDDLEGEEEVVVHNNKFDNDDFM